MGLDMYLHKRKYFRSYDLSKPGLDGDVIEAKITVERTYRDGTSDTEEMTVQEPRGSSSIAVETPVAYWRKANMIHRWFLKAGGVEVDDCTPIYIKPAQLQELIDTCKEVLADHSKAEKLLPTQSGCFFGDTEYNEYYFDDLEDTIKQLEGQIDPECSYIYQASW